MRKGLIIGLMAGAIAMSAISCTKADDTLAYNNATMGNIVNGVFTSDQGNIFNVTEHTCPNKLPEMKRAFTICDVLKKSGAAGNEYDIRLHYAVDVLVKDAVAISPEVDMASYKTDPIILKNYWFSGGYINMYFMLPVNKANSKTHTVNLLYEYKDGVYDFSLSHDADGEILKEDGNGSDMSIAYAYVSFPVSTFIKEETAKFTISVNSYTLVENMISAKTQQAVYKGTYIKSSFDQVPPAAVAPAATLNLD